MCFSVQSCLHFSRWVTWKCMLIVCLTIFSSILSPLQEVSYEKVHVYCVFDYFLFNLVSTSGGELCEGACLLCVWPFSLIKNVSASGGQLRATVHVYCVSDYFLFNLASNSVCELRESACLLYVWLFSLQSCLHFSVSYVKVHVYCVIDYFLFNLVSLAWGPVVMWKCMFIVCLNESHFLFNPAVSLLCWCELCESACLLCVWLLRHLFNLASNSGCKLSVKVHVYCVFDFFLFNLVCSTLDCVLLESACLLCLIWLFSLQSWVVCFCLMLQHIHYALTRSLFLFYNRRRVPLESHYLLNKLST